VTACHICGVDHEGAIEAERVKAYAEAREFLNNLHDFLVSSPQGRNYRKFREKLVPKFVELFNRD
jgi:hypothetical protein